MMEHYFKQKFRPWKCIHHMTITAFKLYIPNEVREPYIALNCILLPILIHVKEYDLLIHNYKSCLTTTTFCLLTVQFNAFSVPIKVNHPM